MLFSLIFVAPNFRTHASRTRYAYARKTQQSYKFPSRKPNFFTLFSPQGTTEHIFDDFFGDDVRNLHLWCHKGRSANDNMNNHEFEIFARECRDELLAIACRLLRHRDDAEDAVQETLLKLYAMRHDLAKYHSVEALARVVVRHISLNYLRSQRRHPTLTLRADYEGDAPPDSELKEEAIKSLLRAIDQLPSKQQMILRLRHIEEMDTDDIARIANMSIDAVYQNLSRARRAILQRFKHNNDEA